MEILDILASFLTLTILEIVLGVDNLVFLAILSQRLPKHQQSRARKWGLTFAWVTRLLLLAFAMSLTKFTTPLFSLFGFAFSGRDIFLILGGLFLLTKATQEIHAELEPFADEVVPSVKKQEVFFAVIIQIALLDIIFSLDSVLTAIGLTNKFSLMAAAITIAIIVMIFASEVLSRFIEKHPTIKMLALSFLILIGTVLIADGFHFHISRAYIYFAMAFSLGVEMLNMVSRKRRQRKK